MEKRLFRGLRGFRLQTTDDHVGPEGLRETARVGLTVRS